MTTNAPERVCTKCGHPARSYGKVRYASCNMIGNRLCDCLCIFSEPAKRPMITQSIGGQRRTMYQDERYGVCIHGVSVDGTCPDCPSERVPKPVPPYPDRSCPACDSDEATITPPPTSVLPIVWPVHRPSGMVCVKWMQPEIYDALKKAGKA